jgi:murein DD-endopeptidase MepM/ murein hydrolase activator NlpD
LNSARGRLNLVRQRLDELAAEQTIVQSEIEQAQAGIARSQVLIGRIVRYQYQTGGYAELQVVLDAESPSDFVQRLMATQSVTETQAEVIDQLQADQAVLTSREQQMEVTQQAIEKTEAEAQKQVEEMRDLVSAARTARQRIERLESLRSQALQVAREEKAAEVERLQQLETAQQALQTQIGQAVSTGSGQATGVLTWPIPGASPGQGVGWRTHPVYGYRSCHTGVDIGSPSGTPILAAADGVVVWTRSELSGPWGNNTLIDHGNGLSTFYPHQSTFNVTVGQRVKKGDVIGYVGATGYVTGPHLHFEVHINGVPFDPMGWFGGSKISQSEFCP